MTYSRRRRRNIRLVGEPKPILTTPEPSEESISITNTNTESQEATNPTPNHHRQLEHFYLTNSIDQIRSELDEEKRSALVESDYGGETHSWGADNQLESDDYWHFLGRFE